MKKILLIGLLFFTIKLSAQVLAVPEIIQEQNQWCWSGVSKCILDYYGYPQQQCDIAEYARTVITWTSFGTQNCCSNPNAGCNYWNYNWGSAGSIQDILVHFGNIQNYGIGGTISPSQIATESAANRPFVVRWGWNTGGGHFVVGHGVAGNDVYYMNPWFGEGLHISTFSWLVNDGNHTWTHTNVLTSVPTGIYETGNITGQKLFPNPAKGFVNIKLNEIENEIKITDNLGKLVHREIYKNTGANSVFSLDISDLSKGIYFVSVKNTKENINEKLIVN